MNHKEKLKIARKMNVKIKVDRKTGKIIKYQSNKDVFTSEAWNERKARIEARVKRHEAAAKERARIRKEEKLRKQRSN